ncbi:MAG: TIGR04197 family type VII secretion effector [Hespellia sp.]|nr:TIGR04197 family type VII secretion effector [Hespellia sp.]
MGNMNINSASVEGSAAQIANAANCFQIRNLSSQDSRSKISANANGKRAFQEAQANMQAFAVALDQDAANIRSLNVAFHQYDAMISDMLKNG